MNSSLFTTFFQTPTSPKLPRNSQNTGRQKAETFFGCPQKIKAHLRWGGHTTPRSKDRPPGAICGALTEHWILTCAETNMASWKIPILCSKMHLQTVHVSLPWLVYQECFTTENPHDSGKKNTSDFARIKTSIRSGS